MIKARTPLNEQERLDALHEYKILDTPEESEFDDIATISAYICSTPIALVSLVDARRQWFKARVGVDAKETPRDIAFCAHAILGSDPLIVPDALEDERFADNPLVTLDPRVRFYAGVPLITPAGHALGTLCAIDRQPRTLEPQALHALQALARQVVLLLEHRRVSAQLADSLERIQLVSGLVPICSHCKSIRKDDDYWSSVETFLRDHAGADLTHGICPQCIQKHFPDIVQGMDGP
jgi:GAF domain-containing protein